MSASVLFASIALAGLAAAGDDPVLAPGQVLDFQRIAEGEGGFSGTLEFPDELAYSLASVGDLNGDGTRDLAVGVSGYHFNEGAGGRVWIFLLRPDGTVLHDVEIAGGSFGLPPELATDDVLFGLSVAGLGDVNGDGIGDLAVGAPQEGARTTGPGTVWILFLDADGSVKGFQEISDHAGGIEDELDDSFVFGFELGTLGDLDGNGVTDLAVRSRAYIDGPVTTTSVLWFLLLEPDGTVGGLVRHDGYYADSLAGLGDLDGDGVPDLALGSTLDAGQVTILFLDAAGGVLGSQVIAEGQGGFGGPLSEMDYFGAAVARLGDLDGDGVTELAVGTPLDDDGCTGPNCNRGAVWILFLNRDGTVHGAQKISDLAGGFAGRFEDYDAFGSSLAALGDANGDLKRDLAVGAPVGPPDLAGSGKVWILFLDGALQLPAAVVPYGCGVNPAGSLVTSGLPAIGQTVTFALDNPLGTQAPGALPLLALATGPAPGFPCGTLLPGFGMLGQSAVGELLLSGPQTLSPPLVGPPWLGAGQPASIPLAIPLDGSLVGALLDAQGLIFDPAPAAPVPFGLTGAVVLRLGAGE